MVCIRDKYVFFQRMSVYCKNKIPVSQRSCVQAGMFCPVPPTGNNLSDSITLQYLSQSHGLPGKQSAPPNLLQCRLASLFGLSRFQEAIASSASVSAV